MAIPLDPMSILGFVQLAITAAPRVQKVVDEGKKVIQNLFKAGLITKEVQDEQMKWADDHMNATLAGEKPEALKKSTEG